MNNKTTILITGMGSTTAISILKGLKAQKEIPLRIIGVDINDEKTIAGSSMCDLYYKIPLAVDKDYIPTLLDICTKESVNIMFPVIDIELEVISRQLDVFKKKGITVWVSAIDTIEKCNDKYNTYNFFKQHEIPTPESWIPENLPTDHSKLRYPLIVKPRDGVSSRDVFTVTDPTELAEALKVVKKAIIQHCSKGKEYTIDVLCDASSNVLAAIPRERIETKSGISYKGVTVRDKQLIDYGTKIAKLLKIQGACNIQCIVENGTAQFFEVNPRFSGSFPLTLASGVNSPYILTRLALKQPLEKKYFEFKEGVYMARYWEEVFYS